MAVRERVWVVRVREGGGDCGGGGCWVGFSRWCLRDGASRMMTLRLAFVLFIPI